jgi:hypothetical protein
VTGLRRKYCDVKISNLTVTRISAVCTDVHAVQMTRPTMILRGSFSLRALCSSTFYEASGKLVLNWASQMGFVISLAKWVRANELQPFERQTFKIEQLCFKTASLTGAKFLWMRNEMFDMLSATYDSQKYNSYKTTTIIMIIATNLSLSPSCDLAFALMNFS